MTYTATYSASDIALIIVDIIAGLSAAVANNSETLGSLLIALIIVAIAMKLWRMLMDFIDSFRDKIPI